MIFKKRNKNFFPKNKQHGAAMLIVVVFFLFISLAIVFGLVSPQIQGFKNSNINLKSKQSYFLAESGNEDAFYRILHNMPISETENITLGSSTVNTTITTILGNTKQIVSTGDVSSLERISNLTLKPTNGVVFKYGTQAGQGGFVFHNNSYVLGSLYSGGDIVGSNGAYITGDAYVAGETGLISNMCIGGVQESSCSSTTPGNAHAHTVTNSNTTGIIYCQTGSGNNKACDTSEADPVSQDLPISDEDITKWEDDATLGGITNENVTISANSDLGPQKIVGDLTVNNNVTLTITGTVYVTGNITITGTVKLGSSYGAASGIIMSDGYIIINNGVVFQDSGTAGSYILLLSNSTCDASMTGAPCNGHSAIEVGNTSDISIVNAQKGTVYFSNVSSVKESVGNKIELKQNVGISYGSGLIGINFTSGPSGSWGVDSWTEIK